MQKRDPKITLCLKQLTKNELFKIAKMKKAKIPASWTKSKIVDALSIIVRKKDLSKIMLKKSNNKVKATNSKEPVKRKNLEDRVLKIFQRKGYRCLKKYQIHNSKLSVVGYKKGGLFSSDKYVVVDCKEKNKVVMSDFKKLVANLILYIKKNRLNTDCVKGYLYTTGLFDKEVRVQAKKISSIELKRLAKLNT
jgi:hypothetical protein